MEQSRQIRAEDLVVGSTQKTCGELGPEAVKLGQKWLQLQAQVEATRVALYEAQGAHKHVAQMLEELAQAKASEEMEALQKERDAAKEEQPA